MEASLIFGADIYPERCFAAGFETGNIEDLIDKGIKNVLFSADFRFYNLETPIADGISFAKKAGPQMCVGLNKTPGLQALKPSLLGLGNNHIMDCGENGFRSTIAALDKLSIPYTGVGKNREEAEKPCITEINGIKIGFYNCEEHSACFAGKNSPGAAPYDPLYSFDIVQCLKRECSFVFVIFHGGKENYQYPTPELQRICRKFVEVGADAVICQHSHCVGCEEYYQNGYINYGQGNFFFDMKGELAEVAMLIKFVINDIHQMQVDVIPIVKLNSKMTLAENDRRKSILDSYHERGKRILEDGFVEAEFGKLASKLEVRYLMWMIGEKKRFRLLNKLTRKQFARKYYSDKEARRLLNTISCRSHEELLEQVIRNKLKD